MARQFIKAEWYTPQHLKRTVESGAIVRKIDYISQGLKPEANNPSRVLCELKNMPLAYYDIPTSNRQLFQKKLWDRLLTNEDLTSRMRETRSFWGEPFHADSMEIKLTDVSHKVTDFRIDKDNLVSGDVAIVDTPNGNIIYSLLQDAWVGISSRGYGSLLDGDDGTNQIVSADDYYHVSWDFVGVPAVQAAMATLSSYAKSSKLEEPIFRSLLASAIDIPGLQSVAQGLKAQATPFSVTVPGLSGIKSGEGSGEASYEAAPSVESPKASADGYHIVEREDGTFWIEDKARGFEQGPYNTKEVADERLAFTLLNDVATKDGSGGVFSAALEGYIKQFHFEWDVNSIPFPKEADDGKWYLQFGKDMRLGPFISEEAAMKVVRQQTVARSSKTEPRASIESAEEWNVGTGNYEGRPCHYRYHKRDKLLLIEFNDRKDPDSVHRADPSKLTDKVSMSQEEYDRSAEGYPRASIDESKKPITSMKSGKWGYESAHGGLALTYEGKDVAFLQGDEASELMDQLEAAKTDEAVDMVLDPYLVLLEQSHKNAIKEGRVLTKKEVVKSEDLPPALEGDIPADGADAMSDEEARDRQEFSDMVLLELAEAVGTDDSVDEFDEGDPDSVDNTPGAMTASKKPVQSAAGDLPAEPPALDGDTEAGDDFSEDEYFPTDEEGSVTVDEKSGTITIQTVGGAGESAAVELTLEDGTLAQGGTDQFAADDLGGEVDESVSIFPSGELSVDLFDETNGDVSAAVDYILDLGSVGSADGAVLDMTDDDFSDDEDEFAAGGATEPKA